MPAAYVAIKKSLEGKYKSEKLRKKHAAMIFNAMQRKHGKPGLSPKSDGEVKGK